MTTSLCTYIKISKTHVFSVIILYFLSRCKHTMRLLDLLAGIPGSNPAGGMDVYLLCLSYVFR
jgi:hypothetical protein